MDNGRFFLDLPTSNYVPAYLELRAYLPRTTCLPTSNYVPAYLELRAYLPLTPCVIFYGV